MTTEHRSEVHNEFSYLLYLDEDAIPLAASMTLGNHLDNEIMIAGEDVADFHLRVEVTTRGPIFLPLGQATFSINGVETDQPVRAIIGDILGVGQNTLQLGMEVEIAQPEVSWHLVSEGVNEHSVIGEIAIGRADGADVTLADAHISRFHARLIEHQGYVWIQDLGSANGTKVNGERIHGGVRMFHGDRLNFDRFEFQIVARGEDITPLASFEEPERGSIEALPQQPNQQNHVSQTTRTPNSQPRLSHEEGPCLVQLDASNNPTASFQLGVEENIVGTHGSCEVCIHDTDVDERHLRIMVSIDGIRLTNISSVGRTLVNGAQVDSVMLRDGDTIHIGSAQFVLRLPDPATSNQASGFSIAQIKPVHWAGMAALGVALLLLLLL